MTLKKKIIKKGARVYMDFASTTPIDEEVLKAMNPYFAKSFANPSSIYREGVESKKAVVEARRIVATELSVRPEEIFFTSSGTESNNLALLGTFRASKKKVSKPHVITSVIEHPSILETMKQIEREGGEVTSIPVLPNGIVDVKKIREAIRSSTVLISIMYANNEIGTIQPIREIARIIADVKKEGSEYPLLHTDASQAPNYLPAQVDSLKVDLLTLDASKIYGPKGVGALFVKRNIPIEPILFGGGQERGLRSGTENVAGIIGMAKALEIAGKKRKKEVERLTKLRDYFIERVLQKFPKAKLNGDKENRLANNVNFCFEGLDAEFAVLRLDEVGIICSSASACNNLSENSASYVIGELEDGKKCARSSLRFTLGRSTVKKDIDATLVALEKVLL